MSQAAITTTTSPAANGIPHAIKSFTKPIITTSSRETVLPPTPSSTIPAWVQPDLTRLLRVERNPGSFASRSISLVTLPPYAIFARISNPTPATVAYSSVQASRDLHIELNCDLVYVNHSCDPSLVFDMQRWEVRVGEKGIKEGEELTFFYPSTEWDMAQPFECLCGMEKCVRRVTGAKDMSRDVLGGYWLSGHIQELLEEKERGL
ncbi:hypothetical protein EK21DRAFT_93550 [Setomelanomma holmii]|uniref:Post-SET domain-containing protein n=1 Tax=Setomelanomma holmii TaxID=210430 RepID=A0A9P4LG07_9PLEO|nr:hypothetical protein EK21DRAFT_93550 [Setomelanomma holmii]